MTLLVTGGAGFIGCHFVLEWLARNDEPVVNLDALTYAGELARLAPLAGDARHRFVQGDINDRALLDRLLAEHRPSAVLHFAAETHVDRSLDGPEAFLRANVDGTFTLLEAARAYWQALAAPARDEFRFLHVSTDEVYGSLAPDAPLCDEAHAFAPNSPYSATKAASDHLVRAWHRSYGLPVLTTACSNNHGPFQVPEKLIPRVIANALAGLPLPIFGDGLQERDWLYVADHCSALRAVLARGRVGERYNIAGGNPRSNLALVQAVCALLDALRPDPAGPHARLVRHVADRPGHDRRYALDTRKIEQELGWQPAESFDSGLWKTVQWYLSRPGLAALPAPAP